MRIHLRHPLAPIRHLEHSIYALAAVIAVLLASYGIDQFFSALPPVPAVRVAEAGNGWQKFSVAARTPEILGTLSIPELSFRNQQQIPVAQIDGAAFKGRLPETLWVKLDQPGNAYLIAETDAGAFIKVLQDASPGFASPCKLKPYEFATLQGEPIFFDRDELFVKTLWIVQDATAEAGRAPGWVRLPEKEVSLASSPGK